MIELTALEATIEIATPSTVICRIATKNRFKRIFNTPEDAKAIKGILVSLTLLKIADSKLYSKITGIPIKYTFNKKMHKVKHLEAHSALLVTV